MNTPEITFEHFKKVMGDYYNTKRDKTIYIPPLGHLVTLNGRAVREVFYDTDSGDIVVIRDPDGQVSTLYPQMPMEWVLWKSVPVE